MGTEPTNGASKPAMIPPTTIRISRRTTIAATVTSKPRSSFGTISNPPKCIHHAHPHGSKTRKKAADETHEESCHEPKQQDGRREKENRHQPGQRAAKERNRRERKAKAKKPADDGNHERLAQDKGEDLAVGKTDRFQYGKLAGALANRDGHGVARHKKQREENDGADGHDQKLDVAELLDPTCRKRGFRFCFGFVRRIGEFRIDGLGNAGGIIRIVDLHNVPPDLPLKGLRNALFKIVPLKPKLRLVVPGAFSVIHTINVELPGTPHGRLDGNAVADFPMEALHRSRADNGAFTVLQKRVPLVVWDDELGYNLPLILRIDDELREEVLLVDVGTAEPVVVRDSLDSRNAEDFVAVGKRDRIDDGSAVNDDEAIGAGEIGAAEGVANHTQKGEEKQRDREGRDGEQQAHLLAKQVG